MADVERLTPRRISRAVIASAIVLGTFLLGLASPWFYNDHFDSLSRARQVLVVGPGSVFESLDWGRPLQIYLSAAFQYVSGNTLLGEAILTVGAMATTVGVVFLLGSEITGSVLAGLLAALFTVWIDARLYNYPKLLAPTVGLWLIWRFIDRPTPGRACGVGIWTAVAFLLRHDLGIYVGVAALLAMVLRGFRRPTLLLSRLAIMTVAAGLVVAPYAWFLIARGNLGSEGQRGFSNLLNAATLTRRAFDIRAEPPLRWVAAQPPTVTIRWRGTLSDSDRAVAEQRLGLRDARDHEPPQAWSYSLERFSKEDLRQLVNHPDVEDTARIDRSTLQVIEPWAQRLGRRWSVFRLRPAEWLWSRRNAEAWIYYVFVVGLAFGAIISIPWTPSASATVEYRKKLWTVLTLSALPTLFLIRHNLDSRLADAAPLSFVVLVWLLHSLVTVSPSSPHLVRMLRRAAAIFVVLMTWASLTIVAGSEPLSRTVSRIAALPVHLPESVRSLRKRPIDTFAPEGTKGIPRLARWILGCTSPADRILVVGYYPEVFFYSERAFAGGMAFFHPPYFNDEAFQSRIVEQLQKERVPIVVVELPMLERSYERVAEYVHEQFVAVTETDFEGSRHFQILVRRDLNVATSEKYPGLPCLRPL